MSMYFRLKRNTFGLAHNVSEVSVSRVLQLPSVASATHRLKAERSRRPAMKCTLVPSALHQAMS